VTVKLKLAAILTGKGTVTAKREAAFTTVIGLETPVIVVLAVSVAVMVWLPASFSVAVNVPAPPVSVELAGKTAWLSVLVKRTVPE